MLRQYGAQRVRPSKPMIRKETKRRGKVEVTYTPDPTDFNLRHRVGTVGCGTIVYLQDNHGAPTYRNPWIVMAWTNREYFPAVKGAPAVTYLRGGHLAVVKSLRDGRTKLVADHIILRSLGE